MAVRPKSQRVPMLQFTRRAIVCLGFLALCAIIGAWIRSYSLWDDIECRATLTVSGRAVHRTRTVYSSYGGVLFNSEDVPVVLPLAPSVRPRPNAPGGGPIWRDGLSRTSGGHSIIPRYPIAGPGGLTTTWYFGHGFQFGSYQHPAPFPYTGNIHEGTWACFPYWSLAMVAGILPAWAAARAMVRLLRRRHRRAKGFCLRCGYDLRQSADRCPECGTSVT